MPYVELTDGFGTKTFSLTYQIDHISLKQQIKEVNKFKKMKYVSTKIKFLLLLHSPHLSKTKLF